MVTKSFLFHFIQPENGWGSLVYILGLVIAINIPIYLQSSESSLGQLWLATVCWEIQFHNWLVLVINYQLRSMSFPSPFVFNTDTNAFTMLRPNPWLYIKVLLQGRTWGVFETLATLKTRAFFQANAHFLQALLFMKFCGPLDNSDPCKSSRPTFMNFSIGLSLLALFILKPLLCCKRSMKCSSLSWMPLPKMFIWPALRFTGR